MSEKTDTSAQLLLKSAYSKARENGQEINLPFVKANKDISIWSDVFVYALKQGYIPFAKLILEYEPQYIERKNLTAEIYHKVIANNKTSAEVLNYLSTGVLDFNSENIDTQANLVSAIDEGQIKLVTFLLRNDTKATLKGISSVSSNKFDRALRKEPLDTLKLLYDRGLNFKELTLNGVKQLSYAMSLGDEARVTFLLTTASVNPATVVFGSRVIDLEIAGDKNVRTRITEMLKKYGADQDYYALARKVNGVVEDPNCTVGDKLEQSSYINSEVLIRYKKNIEVRNKKHKGDSYRYKPDVIDYCELSLVVCSASKLQRNSLDSCITSIPSCPDSPTIDISVIKPNDICCPAEIKEVYVKSRCAGFDSVTSVLYHFKGMGFNETYTIPTFLTNTKEYEKLYQNNKTIEE